jgi:hypothetical protein
MMDMHHGKTTDTPTLTYTHPPPPSYIDLPSSFNPKMKLVASASVLLLALVGTSQAFTIRQPMKMMAAAATKKDAAADGKKTEDPLMLRAARGEVGFCDIACVLCPLYLGSEGTYPMASKYLYLTSERERATHTQDPRIVATHPLNPTIHIHIHTYMP